MKSDSRFRSWILIAVVLLLFGTAVASSQYKVPVIMTQITQQFGMTDSSASWLMSIFTFVGIILAIPTGALAKKFGPKILLIAASAILLVGSIIGIAATDGTMLIVSRGVEGVAFILVTICGPLAVQKYVAPENRLGDRHLGALGVPGLGGGRRCHADRLRDIGLRGRVDGLCGVRGDLRGARGGGC